MDAFFFHPRIVHLPIALAVVIPLVALAVALCAARGWLPRRTWWLVVGLQVMLVGSAIAALRTGEAEEDRVERFVPHAAIHAHEEAAEGFTAGAGVVLALMIVGGLLGERRSAGVATALAVLGSAGVLALGARTGHAGGELVYVHGAGAAYTGAAPPANTGGDDRHDDDRDDH